MPIFYLQFRVVPTTSNPSVNAVDGALASCWIDEDAATVALAKARFYVRRFDWEILKVEKPPTEVTEDNFRDRDVGLQQYRQAAEKGLAISFVAWATDGKTRSGPVTLARPDDFDLNLYLADRKKLKQKGRCLHYQAGRRCSHAIDAHSIQKNGALALIADNGHVYAMSSNFGDVRRHRGAPSYTKQGIQKVSTFRGFCAEHDHQLFRPIDTLPLIPTEQQALLYAYRSLCRETFVKENGLRLLEKRAGVRGKQPAVVQLLDQMRRGTTVGLNNLLRHKVAYEQSLESESYAEVNYVAFCSRQEPTLAFSGLFFPDFDFIGERLQNLGDRARKPDLLTFSFAPLESGWAVLFAWHSDSSKTCAPFMSSLANRIHADTTALGDHLFRLVISCCENVAIAPRWWEHLPEVARLAIQEAAGRMADIFALPEPDYLARGLEGISTWRFDGVMSSSLRETT
jgi:hypothetical protein